MNTLPFKYQDLDTPFKRLIIEPIKQEEEITESGLKIPAHDLNESEVGIVQFTDKDSTFKEGDEVQYKKVDRANTEKLESVSIEGKVYDVVYEHKIACVNDKPYNQIFVKPVSEFSIEEGGLVIPADVASITRKGIVYAAPDYFHVKKGDRVEYYNQLKGFYPQVVIEGETYECINEEEIFIVNEEVAPHRIIVRIDLAAQHIKRSSTHSGLKLSPLFIAMLRNLQYAVVDSIGTEAKKKYPMLAPGDTIIIDHAVESQDYRLVKSDLSKKSKEKHAIYDYRIINCYDFSEREIFGKLKYDKNTGRIIDILPLNDSIFLEWPFEHFDQNKKSALINADTELSQYKNLADIRNVVDSRRKIAAETAKMKMNGLRQVLSRLNPEKDKDQWEAYAKTLALTEREEKKISAELRADLWVVCKTIFPRQLPAYIISPYETLYPINLLGQKFLIGHKDFLLLKTNKNMNITSTDLLALSDNVLVLPIEEKQETQLVIPDAAKSKPQYGTVVAIGENNDGVKKGDFILYRQYAGLQQKINGVDHLIMKQNDLLMVVSERK